MHIFWILEPSSFWSTIEKFHFWNKKIQKLTISDACFRPLLCLFTISRKSGNSRNQNKNILQIANSIFLEQKFQILSKNLHMELWNVAKDISKNIDDEISAQEHLESVADDYIVSYCYFSLERKTYFFKFLQPRAEIFKTPR